MAYVSLVFPITPRFSFSPADAESFACLLEQEGHEVEVLFASGAEGYPSANGELLPFRRVVADQPGMAAAVMAGLDEASGDILVAIDPTMKYGPEDVLRLVEALASGTAELVVASRFASPSPGSLGPPRGGHLRGWVGSLLRPLVGSSDPMSGLVGLTREQFEGVAGSLRPLGTKFTAELLTRTGGRWLEVPSGAGWPTRWWGLEYDDLRQLKRLSDHRFGNLSRLFQFCVVGASGMVVDLTCYAAFQWLFARTWLAHRTVPFLGALDLAAAGALAIWLALTWNFSLNRRLTFSYARGQWIVRQYIMYALSNALGIAVSFLLRITLPQYVDFFDRHKLAAALVGIVTATGISFSMSRWVVFRHHTEAKPAPLAEAVSTLPASH